MPQTITAAKPSPIFVSGMLSAKTRVNITSKAMRNALIAIFFVVIFIDTSEIHKKPGSRAAGGENGQGVHGHVEEYARPN